MHQVTRLYRSRQPDLPAQQATSLIPPYFSDTSIPCTCMHGRWLTTHTSYIHMVTHSVTSHPKPNLLPIFSSSDGSGRTVWHDHVGMVSGNANGVAGRGKTTRDSTRSRRCGTTHTLHSGVALRRAGSHGRWVVRAGRSQQRLDVCELWASVGFWWLLYSNSVGSV